MIKEPNCYKRKCRHFIGAKYVDEKVSTAAMPICKAFPDDGIPFEIAYGDNKHTKLHPDQTNNILFEPITTTEEG